MSNLLTMFGILEGKETDDTKLISIFGVIASALILFYAVHKELAGSDVMFIAFIAVTCGMKVSKGIVTTFQKRDQLKGQKYERNNDIECDFDFVTKCNDSELEATKSDQTAR